MAFLSLKSPLPLFHIVSPTKIWAFFFNKVVSSTRSDFSFDFPLFFMFLSPTCCGVWLFVGFCVGDSDDNVASIRQRSHIKSLLIRMFH